MLGTLTSTVLTVLGVHRSGTSALAGAFDVLGAAFGPRIMAPSPDNELGYFENADIVSVSDDLLVGASRTWADPRPVDLQWIGPEARLACVQRYADVLEGFDPAAPVWVVKDPRLCLLVPVWREALVDRNSVFVLVHRPFAEVARSLQRRNAMPVEVAALLWAGSVIAAERDTRGLRRAVCSYPAVLADPVGALGAVSAQLGLPWSRPVAEREAELRSFLRSDLRHHRSQEPIPETLPDELRSILALVSEGLYDSLGDAEAATSLERFDEAAARLAAWWDGAGGRVDVFALDLYARAVAEIRDVRRVLAVRTEWLGAQERRIAELAEASRKQQQWLAAISGDLARHRELLLALRAGSDQPVVEEVEDGALGSP